MLASVSYPFHAFLGAVTSSKLIHLYIGNHLLCAQIAYLLHVKFVSVSAEFFFFHSKFSVRQSLISTPLMNLHHRHHPASLPLPLNRLLRRRNFARKRKLLRLRVQFQDNTLHRYFVSSQRFSSTSRSTCPARSRTLSRFSLVSTAHSAQRTAHSAQRTAHSAQRTAHSAQRTAHAERKAHRRRALH
jgi:hypothetical protein